MPYRASLLRPGGLPQGCAHPAAGAGTGFMRLSGRLGFLPSGDWDSGNPAFAISRGSPGTPPCTPQQWLPVSWHAVFPVHLSDHGSAIRSKDTSSSPCPLRGLYSSAPRGARRVGCTRGPISPLWWYGPFPCSLPPNPVCTVSMRRALRRFYAACAVGLAWIQPFLPRSRRTLSTTAASCISHASWPGAIHRLCPFALWTAINGRQIGRTLPRATTAALRRHRTRVP